jgi:hypothetical protein
VKWSDEMIDPDLAELNALFAVLPVGNTVRVMRTLEGEPPEFFDERSFRLLYMNRKKPAGRGFIALGTWWLNHEHRRQYNGIDFMPGEPRVLPGSVYNTWSGWPFEPVPADCPLFMSHVRDNVCGGDAVCFEYLLGWMADAVQNPGRLPEVAVVLCGRPGTGKGVFVHAFGELFGRHYVYVSQGDHLVGKFNKHLAEAVVVFADEAFFAGDVKHKSQLKAQITEPSRMLEPKGIDVIPVRNCMHLIMASNETWVVPAGPDERRYFVLNVGADHIQDLPYFTAIKAEMATGGREALFHMLMTRDLSSFNKRQIPQTEALAEQKALGRNGIDGFIEDACRTGIIPCLAVPYSDRKNPTLTFTGVRETTNRFGDIVYSKGLEHYLKETYPVLRYSTPIQIRTALVKEWKWSDWRDKRARGLRAPPLFQLRELFDAKWGPQEWPADIRFWADLNDINEPDRRKLITPDDEQNKIKKEAADKFNVSPDDLDIVDPDDPSERRLPADPERRPTPGLLEALGDTSRVGSKQDSGKKILIVLTDAALHIRDGRPVSVAGEDACGCFRALQRQGHEPVLLVDDLSTPGPYRIAHDDVDVNQFDELMLNREGPNFIGGTVHERHLWTARAVCRFEGRVSYLFADPEMKKGEYLAAFLHDLYELKGMKNYQGRPIYEKGLNDLISRSMLEDNLHKTSKERALVRSGYPCGPDHPIYKKRGFVGEIQFVDSWREALFNIRMGCGSDTPFEGLLKSACYVGNFKPARRRRLHELELLDPSAEDEGLIKYYGKMARFTAEARGEKVQRLGGAQGGIGLDAVSDVYGKHVASLVIGHPDQRNTGLNHRFLQGLLVKRSMLVDHYQDEAGLLCCDPRLRTTLYFTHAGDYLEKLQFIRKEAYFDKVVRSLMIEAERVKGESVEGLLARVRGQ